MAAFLAGKLAREKNGRFGKAWLGKRGGKVLKSLKVQKHPFFLEHGGVFSTNLNR